MPDQFDRLADAQASRQGQLSARTLGQLTRLWNAVSNHADPEQVATFSARASVVVRSAELATGRVTEAYLRQVLRQLGITAPVQRLVDLPESLRGDDVVPQELYQRPSETVRYLLSTQVPRSQAVQEGLARLSAIAATNLQLALRQSTVDALSRTPGVSGYRRILRPYLSKGGSCGLCIAAADRVYRKGSLMPIHAHCKCAVMPITRAGDPGLELNRADLDQLYRRAGSTEGDALKATRYQVQQHGELGPVLVPYGQRFRTEGQARRATRRTSSRRASAAPAASGAGRPVAGRRDAAAARQALASFESNLPSLLERAAAGEDVAAAVAYHRGQIAFIRRELARLPAA